MKQILLLIIMLFLTLSANAYNIETVPVNYQVLYSPSLDIWSLDDIAGEKIVLTKKKSAKKDDFSNYSYNTDEIKLNSNYEFIFDSKLIAVDNNNFKYYEIKCNNLKIEQVQLSVNDLKKIFPDAEIIKISDFKKGCYNIISGNTDKKVLIYNDTTLELGKFQVTPLETIVDSNIKGLIQLPKKGKVKISDNTNWKSKSFIIKVK